MTAPRLAPRSMPDSPAITWRLLIATKIIPLIRNHFVPTMGFAGIFWTKMVFIKDAIVPTGTREMYVVVSK